VNSLVAAKNFGTRRRLADLGRLHVQCRRQHPGPAPIPIYTFGGRGHTRKAAQAVGAHPRASGGEQFTFAPIIGSSINWHCTARRSGLRSPFSLEIHGAGGITMHPCQCLYDWPLSGRSFRHVSRNPPPADNCDLRSRPSQSDPAELAATTRL
jgi:hypothetical protein